MNGKFSASRFQSNREPFHGIHLTLVDETSGCQMIEIILTPEQWGNAVSGLGQVDCAFELGSVEMCGLKREVKTVKIPVTKYPTTYSPKEVEKLLEQYEVDGWKARERDFQNHHNFNENSVSVIFTRYISPVQTK